MMKDRFVGLTCVRTLHVLSVIILLAGGALSGGMAPLVEAATTCFSDMSDSSLLPGDPGSSAMQPDFDAFSWQTFLALNAPGLITSDDPASIQPIWAKTADQAGWSSTADILNQLETIDTITQSGNTVTVESNTLYPAFAVYDYPEECTSISGPRSPRRPP